MISGKTIGQLEDLYDLIDQSDQCSNYYSSDQLSEMQDPITLVSSKFVQLTNNFTASNAYTLDLTNPNTATKDYIQIDYQIDNYSGNVNVFALFKRDLITSIEYSWLELNSINTSISNTGSLLLENIDNVFGNKEFLSIAFSLPIIVTPTGLESVTYSVYSVNDSQIRYQTCNNIINIERKDFFDSYNGTNTIGNTFYIGTTAYTDSYDVNTLYYKEKDTYPIVLPPLVYIKFISGTEEREISFDCVCNQDTLCGYNYIEFYQNCGSRYDLVADFGIYNGKYEYSTKNFTGLNGQIVYPSVSQQAVYNLVFDMYSDSFYLELMDLIANNNYININGFEYYIKKETFEPSYQNPDDFAQVSIEVIRKDTIKTTKRNCCI